jgi:hypothetical protein
MKIKSPKRVTSALYGEWIFINSGYKTQTGNNRTERGTAVKVINAVDTMWENGGGGCDTVVLLLRGEVPWTRAQGTQNIALVGCCIPSTKDRMWRWVPLDNPPVAQLLKSFATFYGIRRFIAAFTRALSHINPVHITPSYPRSILISSFHLGLCLPSVSFLIYFPIWKKIYSQMKEDITESEREIKEQSEMQIQSSKWRNKEKLKEKLIQRNTWVHKEKI